jgi:hypothetical protein
VENLSAGIICDPQIEDTQEYSDYIDSQESAQQHQINGDNDATEIVGDINFVQNRINKWQEKYGVNATMQSAIVALTTVKNKLGKIRG